MESLEGRTESYLTMTEDKIAQMTLSERSMFVRHLLDRLVRIGRRQAVVAGKLVNIQREIADTERDRREFIAQQAYWAAKYP